MVRGLNGIVRYSIVKISENVIQYHLVMTSQRICIFNMAECKIVVFSILSFITKIESKVNKNLFNF